MLYYLRILLTVHNSCTLFIMRGRKKIYIHITYYHNFVDEQFALLFRATHAKKLYLKKVVFLLTTPSIFFNLLTFCVICVKYLFTAYIHPYT